MTSPREESHVTLIDLDAISVTCRLEAGSTTGEKRKICIIKRDFKMFSQSKELLRH